MKKRTIPIRNPVARSPLLRKGGAHVKSRTGQRVRARLSTSGAIDDWLDEVEDENINSGKENGEQMLPGFFCGRHSKEITYGRLLSDSPQISGTAWRRPAPGRTTAHDQATAPPP